MQLGSPKITVVPSKAKVVRFVIFRISIIMGQVKSEFADGNFYRAFTVVDHDFPMGGGAKVALSVLTESNFDSPKEDIRAENKTYIRNQLKTWETSINSDLAK